MDEESEDGITDSPTNGEVAPGEEPTTSNGATGPKTSTLGASRGGCRHILTPPLGVSGHGLAAIINDDEAETVLAWR